MHGVDCVGWNYRGVGNAHLKGAGLGGARLSRQGQSLACGCLAWLLAGSSVRAQDVPRFRQQVISKAAKMGYQLVAADLNGDRRKDLLAVDGRAT